MNLSELASLVRPFVSGCPAPIVEAELLRAARRFCERSQAWRETVYVGMGRNMSNATIPVTSGQSVVAVLRVNIKDQDRPLGSLPSLDDLIARSGTPKHYTTDKTGKLFVWPTPEETVICVVKVAVKPSLTGTTIADDVGQQWGEAIADGAVSNILLMPDSAWYNANQAGFHQSRFERSISEARTALATGMSNASVLINSRPFI